MVSHLSRLKVLDRADLISIGVRSGNQRIDDYGAREVKKMGMKMIDIAWIDWTKLLYFCRDN